MQVVVRGKQGEGKTCLANVIHQALASYRIGATLDPKIPVIEASVAADVLLCDKRIEIRIAEETE